MPSEIDILPHILAHNPGFDERADPSWSLGRIHVTWLIQMCAMTCSVTQMCAIRDWNYEFFQLFRDSKVCHERLKSWIFFFSCHPTSWSIQSSMSARRSRLGRRWYLRSRAPVSGSWWYNSVWVMSLVCHSYEWYITHVNESVSALQHAATHCNTLQHTATHCNTLQHTATHCNTWYNSGITPMLIAHLWMTYGATQVSFAKEPYKRNDILQKKSLCQYRS